MAKLSTGEVGVWPIVFVVAMQTSSFSSGISHPVYPPDTTIAETSVLEYMTMPESELERLITEEGGTGTNVTMRQVTYRMANLYHKTGKDEYADRAVLLLERFALVVGSWPMRDRHGVSTPLEEVDWGDWANGGLWGDWHHEDLKRSHQLVLAYDLLVDSGAMERRGAETRETIEVDLLRYLAEFNLRGNHLLRVHDPQPDGRAPFDFSNMGGSRIEGLIPFGLAFDPGYIHLIVKWLRAYPSVVFFRDGVWHETSPSYHEQITERVGRGLPKQLRGYSDPPGYVHPAYGTRIDDLDIEAGLESQFARIRGAMEHLTLPNDSLLALHDAHSHGRSWHVERDTSESYCYFGMRHAVLGRFSGGDQVQTHLHFGGAAGHEHYDCLNLMLWALGGELLSDGEYKIYGNREWNESTAGHNLVVVDEENQRGRFSGRVSPAERDSVDGLSYNPNVYGHGDARNFGNLRLWDPTQPQIQVVEAEGENGYGRDRTPLYRRTLAMVEIEGPAFYLIDVFRVRGGHTHDWMLHGRLNEDYGFETSLQLSATTGTRHGYLQLTHTARTDESWWSEFLGHTGARIRTTMVGVPGTEITVGRAPAMRREGEATFVDVRRKGGESVFVAVHEPYRDLPRVIDVADVDCGEDGWAACLRIELTGGRIDYFASTLDSLPYPRRELAGEGVAMQGRLAHVATHGDSLPWMYLIEGSSLSARGVSVRARDGDLSYRGRIKDVSRIERGASWNGFTTESPLPSDGSLAGKTLLLTLGDGRTEGYTVDRVETNDRESRIYVREEPGMELREDGALAKLVYFPWHGVPGQVDFLISGSVLRDAEGNVTSTAPLVEGSLASPSSSEGER